MKCIFNAAGVWLCLITLAYGQGRSYEEIYNELSRTKRAEQELAGREAKQKAAEKASKDADDALYRDWKDAEDKPLGKAKFIELKGSTVSLVFRGGEQHKGLEKIGLLKLSKEDQQWVKDRVKQQAQGLKILRKSKDFRDAEQAAKQAKQIKAAQAKQAKARK